MSDWAHQLISKCLQRSARRAISPINLYRTRNLSFATSGIAPWWIIEVNACLSNDSKRGPSGGSVPWFLHAFASFLNSCFGDFSVCVCVLPGVCCALPAVCRTPPSGSRTVSSWHERRCPTSAELWNKQISHFHSDLIFSVSVFLL